MRVQKRFGVSTRLVELKGNLEELDIAEDEGRQDIDLHIDFATPLAVLPIAIVGCQNGIRINLKGDANALSYLKTIGFPSGFNKLRATKNYLPITKLPPIERDTVLGDYEEQIMKIAMMDKRIDSFKTSLKYLTSELVNNVNEHARVDNYWLLAQYWDFPNKTCEIVLADCGIGYKESYQGTPYQVSTDTEAILNALEGKSSKKELQRGYGIPSIARLFVDGYGGKLVILSGKSIVYYNQKEKKIIDLNSYWQGSLTVINFNLKTVNPYDYIG
jgi:hypothetical protein